MSSETKRISPEEQARIKAEQRRAYNQQTMRDYRLKHGTTPKTVQKTLKEKPVAAEKVTVSDDTSPRGLVIPFRKRETNV